MRLPAIALLFFILISPFIHPSFAQENEKFPALMFLVIEPVGPAVAEIEPMGHYSFKFKFYNGGYFQDNLYAFWTEFRVEVEGKEWSAYVSPTHTYFYPSEKKYGVINVVAGARPSNFAYIHLYGRFRDIYGFWHHANYTFQVRTTQYHSFDARIENVFIKARQDEIYSVPITVKNFGNQEDVFYLDAYYIPPRWQITFVDPILVIPPGGEATTYIYFATPHESIYLQHSTYLLRVKVGAMGGSPKLVTMIVSMEGWNFTPAQIVAMATTFPSFAIVAFLFALSRYSANECKFIPKPWEEYREEIMKLSPEERRKVVKEMKEEWLSSYYYCNEERKRRKMQEKLRKIKERKERRLKERMEKEWNKNWRELERKWEEERDKIRKFYEERKRRIEKLKNGLEIDVKLPEIEFPSKPKKIHMPKIPKYFLDEERGILIEPDEVSLKRIKMAIRNNKTIVEGEKIRMERMARDIIKRLEIQFEKIEREIEAYRKRREFVNEREKILKKIKK